MDEVEEDIGNVVDPEVGLPRVLSSKCKTCIFRPSAEDWLKARKDEMASNAVEKGSWIVCHSTLPAVGIEDGKQAICRGYWDVHQTDSWGCRLATILGGPVFVDQENE